MKIKQEKELIITLEIGEIPGLDKPDEAGALLAILNTDGKKSLYESSKEREFMYEKVDNFRKKLYKNLYKKLYQKTLLK